MVRFLTGILLMSLVIWSCGPSGPTVRRGGLDEEAAAGDRWTDKDSRKVAADMVKDMLSRPWLDRWSETSKRVPRLLVGRVVNRAHYHIKTDMFIKDMEKDLTNSGEVSFVASDDQKSQLQKEKLYQADFASLESQKAIGRELGADFILTGKIESDMQRAGRKAVTYYQTELELLNIETGVKVWIGQSKIKKVIER